MADEQPKQDDPVDPHPVDEDPEEHIGDEIPDPWLDLDEDGNWKPVSN